jgi:hypothetical protein
MDFFSQESRNFSTASPVGGIMGFMVRFLSPGRKIFVHAAHEQVGVSLMRHEPDPEPVPLSPPRLWFAGPPECHAAFSAFQSTWAETLFQSGIFGDSQYAWEETFEPIVHDSILLVGSNRSMASEMLQAIRRHHKAGGTVLGVALGARALAGQREMLSEIFGVELGAPLATGRFDVRPSTIASYHPVMQGVSAFLTETIFPSCRMLEKTVIPLLTARQNDLLRPVAWATARGGLRRFGALLGAPCDFHQPGFLALLRNAVLWTRGEI